MDWLKKNWMLLVVILLGATLRVIHLNDLPYPLNGDEKAFGYYAWSLGRSGTDEYGNRLPIYFPSIGDYKYPLYAYLSVPISYVTGLSEWLPRSLSVMAGIGIIVVCFQVSLLLFKKKIAALGAAFIAATAPWGITFSRTASESNLMTFLILLGVYFLARFLLEANGKRFFVYGVVCYLLASFSYSASRIFIPTFLGIMTFYFLIKKDKVKSVWVGAMFVLLTTIIGAALLNPASRARAGNVSMISRDETRMQWITDSIQAMGIEAQINPAITRVFFNKATAVGWEYAGRYLSHFNPNYLFLRGDIVPQNSIPNLGNFFIIDALFFVIGFSWLVKGGMRFKTNSVLVLAAIMAGPLAAAGSVETPSAVRQLVAFPYLSMCIGLGIGIFLKRIRWALFPLAIGYGYLLLFLTVNLFQVKAHFQPWTSDQGNKELVNKIWDLKSSYRYVFIPQDPYIDFLFYKKIEPKQFLSIATIEEEEVGKWARVKRMENIYFDVPEACPKVGQVKALYVCRGEQIPRGARVVEVIRFKDEVPKYVLVEFLGDSESKAELPSRVKYFDDPIDKNYPQGIYGEENRYFKNWFLHEGEVVVKQD